jgi:hypothetical protein
MPNLTAVLILVVALVLAGIAIWRLAGVWVQYHGRMVVNCPENQKPAGVSVDTRRAVATRLTGKPDLRLATCSRWPERADCGQECLRQLETAPENCRVREILARWYEGKTCAWCGQPVGPIHETERKPTVLLTDQRSVEWNEIPAERLQETLDASLPLCFGCHIANTMRREHPELVIDRSRPALSGGPRGPQTR